MAKYSGTTWNRNLAYYLHYWFWYQLLPNLVGLLLCFYWYFQVAILIIIPEMRGSRSANTKDLLKFLVVLQYVLRILRVFPLYKEVTRTSGILTETAWAGAAFNLLLYMLASHVSDWNSVISFAFSNYMYNLHAFLHRE